MRRFVWLALLLPTFAWADSPQVQTNANDISILEGEQAVQNDRLAEIEEGCKIGVFAAGGWLLDENGDLTQYQWLWHFDGGIGYFFDPNNETVGFPQFTSDGLSTIAGSNYGISFPAFIGTCVTTPPVGLNNYDVFEYTPADVEEHYRNRYEATRFRHELTESGGVCSTETVDGRTVEWACTEVQ